MKHILLFTSLMMFSLSFGQTLIWNDDFEATLADWNLTISTGTNDANANIWTISDEEGGVAPPGCGVASNGNKTLHVTCQGALCIGTGAIYYAGDAGMFSQPGATNKRAALIAPIATTGQTQLELVFDWIGVGQAGQDFAELEYSIDGGITWNMIWSQTPGNICGGGQGEWKEETVTLPVATENQADLRFAFNWKNDNDGAGTDPSFAVNDLRLFTNAVASAPVADFTTANFTICESDCISFTDASTGTNISAWNWTFNGATTPNSTNQNPTNICYPTAGTYDVTLSITDDNGTDNITYQITVNDCSTPNADFTTPSFTICENDCIDFTDASTGTNVSAWSWAFTGADTPTSTSQNPTNICYSTAGNYNVTLTITDDNGTDDVTYQILVNSCSTPPTAAFSADTMLVCKNDCISFTDLSTGNPTSWSWTFDGAEPAFSNQQNPTNICFDSVGVFDITLTVTNDSGTDQIINSITVLDLPVIYGIGDTIIEMGGAAMLEAFPIDQGTVFWTPEDDLDCPTCLDVIATPLLSTTYYPSLIGMNGCIGRDTVIVLVKFKEVVEVPSAFSPNGDGINDFSRVLGVGITKIDFKIYNRYGQMVFSTTDLNEGWDGTMNGEVLNQGVFVYTLSFELIDGSIGEKSGNITLVK